MYGIWGEEAGISTVADRGCLPACTTADGLERNVPCCAGTAGESNDDAQRVRELQAEVAELRRMQAVIHRSFFEAAQVQRRLCAPREVRMGDFEIAGEIFPARHLSGDFFKVIELDGALGIIVGDVAGKGLSAGIWMPHLISLLQGNALAYANPAEVLARANRELCSACGQPPLVAAFFARIDVRDGGVEYCNAGLPSPVILQRDSNSVLLDAGGPMLGAVPEARYQSGRAQLGPGGSLIAYSDGLTECENPREEEFETARLLKAARTFAPGSASQMLFSTLGAVMDFAGGRAPADDLTLLVVRRAAALSARYAPAETFLQ